MRLGAENEALGVSICMQNGGLGQPWAPKWEPWGALGGTLVSKMGAMGLLGSAWGALGRPWGVLGVPLGALGVLLASPWVPLGGSWAPLGPHRD